MRSRWVWALPEHLSTTGELLPEYLSKLPSFGKNGPEAHRNGRESHEDFDATEEGQRASIFDDVPPPMGGR